LGILKAASVGKRVKKKKNPLVKLKTAHHGGRHEQTNGGNGGVELPWKEKTEKPSRKKNDAAPF